MRTVVRLRVRLKDAVNSRIADQLDVQIMRVAAISSATVSAMVLLMALVGLGYYYYQTLGGATFTNSGHTVPMINSSTACSTGVSWEGTEAMDTLRSSIANQAEFVTLAQNRSYYDAGYACGGVNETEFTVVFGYNDVSHPFYTCGGSRTDYPTYFIFAKVYLSPTGYDLSKTTYYTRYYDSQNSTIHCTTATTFT